MACFIKGFIRVPKGFWKGSIRVHMGDPEMSDFKIPKYFTAVMMKVLLGDLIGCGGIVRVIIGFP